VGSIHGEVKRNFDSHNEEKPNAMLDSERGGNPGNEAKRCALNRYTDRLMHAPTASCQAK